MLKLDRRTPYLLLFDTDPANTVVSTSYYQEQMFNLHYGAETLPVTIADGDFNPLFWQASIDDERREIYFKIVNAGSTTQMLDLQLDTAYCSVNGTAMHAADGPEDSNVSGSSREKTGIVPRSIPDLQELSPQRQGSKQACFNWKVPAYSVNVIQFNLADDDAKSNTASEYTRGHSGK